MITVVQIKMLMKNEGPFHSTCQVGHRLHKHAHGVPLLISAMPCSNRGFLLPTEEKIGAAVFLVILSFVRGKQ